MSKLTAIQVRSAKPLEKNYKLTDGHGLHLHISTSGKKTWRYRYRLAGKESTYVLGEYPQMSLEEARGARTEAREKVKDGINPAQERREKKRVLIDKVLAENGAVINSFKAVAYDWIEQQRERWSPGHTNDVLSTLKNDAFPRIGSLRIDTITPPQILEVVRAIEARGSYEIASKVLQRISAICRYAVQTGLATYNPAADMRGALKTRKVQHRAALQENELPEFFHRLKISHEHIVTKSALMFTILTAARSGEVRFATWKEIDFGTRDWRIPAKRMKMNTSHLVPLSKQALTILEAMKAHSIGGYIFPGIKDPDKPLSENTMLYALYRMGYHSRATVHGFRAVFSSITNESGLFDKDAIERQLAHQERNKVRAAYHRSEYLESRREMMQWWADYLDDLKTNS
jgi:integrase